MPCLLNTLFFETPHSQFVDFLKFQAWAEITLMTHTTMKSKLKFMLEGTIFVRFTLAKNINIEFSCKLSSMEVLHIAGAPANSGW